MVPPDAGLLQKWRHYRQKYGIVHAAASYVGRMVPRAWDWMGPLVTRRALRRWLEMQGQKRLNLGSGSHLLDGFLNADVSPRADVYMDVSRPLPLPDRSVDVVLCEEVIEHIPFSDASALARELARVLKPGGCVRVTTPDLEFFHRVLNGSEPLTGMLPADGERFLGTEAPDALLRMGFVNSCFYLHGHRCLYTAAGLTELFRLAGFEHIRRSHYQDGESLLGRYDSHADRFDHPPELSLYVECFVPDEDGRA